MEKAFELRFDQSDFDEKVFNCNSYFSQDEYNDWLQDTVVEALKKVYDEMPEEGKTIGEMIDIYAIGDLINLLENTEMVITKRKE